MAHRLAELRLVAVFGKCDLCGKTAPLDWEHDHALGSEFHRGWACRSCNARLGYWEPTGLLSPDLTDDEFLARSILWQAATGRPMKDFWWFQLARDYLASPPAFGR